MSAACSRTYWDRVTTFTCIYGFHMKILYLGRTWLYSKHFEDWWLNKEGNLSEQWDWKRVSHIDTRIACSLALEWKLWKKTSRNKKGEKKYTVIYPICKAECHIHVHWNIVEVYEVMDKQCWQWLESTWSLCVWAIYDCGESILHNNHNGYTSMCPLHEHWTAKEDAIVKNKSKLSQM